MDCSKKLKLSCEYCEKSFSSLCRLRNHIGKIHGIDTCDERHKKIGCPHPECEFLFQTRNLLREHIIDVHKIPLEVEKKIFRTFEEFELWKENVEREMKCFYAKKQSFYLSSRGDYKNFYFLCHRSGLFSSAGTGKRKIMKCSNKINGYCPSSMEVSVSTKNEKVEVVFWKTHYGHNYVHDYTLELRRLPLSKTEKQAIAEKIMSGQTFSQILDEAKNPVTGADLKRINVLNRKDLHNIVQQYKLKDFVKLDNPFVKKDKVLKVPPGSKQQLNVIVEDTVVSSDEDSLKISMPEDSFAHSPPPSFVNSNVLKEKLKLINEMLDFELKEEEICCLNKTFDDIIEYLNKNRKEQCSLEQKIESRPENSSENFPSEEGCYFIKTAKQNEILPTQNVSNRDILLNIAENTKQVCSLEQNIESRIENNSENILSQPRYYFINSVKQNETPQKQNVPDRDILVNITENRKLCSPEEKIESKSDNSSANISQLGCYLIKRVDQNNFFSATPQQQNVPQKYRLLKVCHPQLVKNLQ